MTKLRRETHSTLSDAAALRIRAAWLYYNEGLTQKDVADRLKAQGVELSGKEEIQ